MYSIQIMVDAETTENAKTNQLREPGAKSLVRIGAVIKTPITRVLRAQVGWALLVSAVGVFACDDGAEPAGSFVVKGGGATAGSTNGGGGSNGEGGSFAGSSNSAGTGGNAGTTTVGGAGGTAGGAGMSGTSGAGGNAGASGAFGGGAGSSGSGGTGPDGIAPDGANPGEKPSQNGSNEVTVAPGSDSVFRVDALPGEHIGFFLTFEPGVAGVKLELSRWDGQTSQVLAFTDGGSGLRTIAAFDSNGPRTFWARVSADEAFVGNLEIVRTPFTDGAKCESDCDRLLQLPVRNEPNTDGYDWTPSTVFRYQFARRDLLMFFRFSARQLALAGRAPIIPEDFSQWDGQTPGVDVGAPRHASHQNGKDVDISLYGTDGLSVWRSYCDAVNTGDGRECVAGTASGLDGRANAEMFGAFFQSQRVTMSFLDQELIPIVIDGAAEAAADNSLDPSLLPLFSDGVHIQHWPNHDNHVHVRISEAAY